MKFTIAITMMVAFFAIALKANASLIGDTVTADRMLGDVSAGGGPFTFVVQAGSGDQQDLSAGTGNLVVDVEGSFIDIFFSAVAGSGFEEPPRHDVIVSGLDWVNNPAGIISSINTTVIGNTNFAPSRASFTPHSIVLDISNLAVNGAPWSVQIDLTTTDSTVVSAVPEPLTAMLGLMGLGVLGIATRRRAE